MLLPNSNKELSPSFFALLLLRLFLAVALDRDSIDCDFLFLLLWLFLFGLLLLLFFFLALLSRFLLLLRLLWLLPDFFNAGDLYKIFAELGTEFFIFVNGFLKEVFLLLFLNEEIAT